jgi:hypothetical protein
MGISMSITAFPVLVRILQARSIEGAPRAVVNISSPAQSESSLSQKKLALTKAEFRVKKNEGEMPPAVGIVIAPFRRDRHDCCLHQWACSGWLASVA